MKKILILQAMNEGGGTEELFRRQGWDTMSIRYPISRCRNVFDYVSSYIDRSLDQSTLRDTIGVLYLNNGYLSDPTRLDSEALCKDYFPITLALVYPEVFWIWVYDKDRTRGVHNNTDSFPPREHYVESPFDVVKKIRQAMKYPSPLFDGFGLRNYIKAKLCTIHDDIVLPLRSATEEKGLAVALDDEIDYATYHAYVAYSMGYTSFAIYRWQQAKEILSKKQSALPISMSMEDVYLRFADSESKISLSDICRRDNAFPGLKAARIRAFITVGHQNMPEGRKKRDSVYLNELKKKGIKIRHLEKPSSGLFHIVSSVGLLDDYLGWLKHPAPQGEVAKRNDEQHGHSAPGALVWMSRILIDRASKILSKHHSLIDCVHGAVLATDAKELIGYKTPTTCMQALALRHEFEVRVECMYHGIQYNIELDERFDVIDREIREASKSFGNPDWLYDRPHHDRNNRNGFIHIRRLLPKRCKRVITVWKDNTRREYVKLNTEIAIVADLTKVFREFGQFDEEQKCLAHLRTLNRWLSRYIVGWRSGWILLFYPIKFYIDQLVSSMKLFVTAVLSWPVLIGFGGWIFKAKFVEPVAYQDGIYRYERIVPSLPGFLYRAFISFFGIDTMGEPGNVAANIVSMVMIIVAFIHLGIFISHLYTIVARR